MNTRKIQFDQEQYLELIQLVYLGRWMVSSHLDDPDTSLEGMEQFIYSNANDFGLGELVDFDADEQEYLPSAQLEEEMEHVIQEYNTYTFWDELAWQMAERDFSKKYDEAQILCMTNEEIFMEKDALSDKYFDEFLQNGLKNFTIVK